MKILIVGTGVVGTTWGWALLQAGNDITHFVKPGKKDRFEDGVRLDLRDGRKGHKKEAIVRYVFECVETISPSDQYELIVVSVNFNQVEQVLDILTPQSGNAIFLILGTNWHGIEAIEKRLPRERYLMGFPVGGGTRQGDWYRVYLGSKIFLGEADGQHTEKLQRIKLLFAQSDIRADIPDNILHALWTAHAVAVGLGAGLAQARDVDSFLRDRALIGEAYHITKEIYGLCRLRGVDPYKYRDQSILYRLPAWLNAIAWQAFIAFDPGIKRILAHAAASRDSEELCVAMLKTAEELNFNMPRLIAAKAHFQNV